MKLEMGLLKASKHELPQTRILAEYSLEKGYAIIVKATIPEMEAYDRARARNEPMQIVEIHEERSYSRRDEDL